MSAVVALGLALAAYTFGFACGWVSRRSRLAARIRELEAEREDWRGVALDANAKALEYRRERDRCRSFLSGVFGEAGQ